ncbi:MAG: excinuclease ABC subunit UvrA [Planctomycetaceae bacterium]|jgi:excinuclease ABC subunit A|nr:excinuclease ABC subunit UvrA [Planctomycetaceae bacterium]
MQDIIIKGAREHNLQGIDLTVPHNKLICFTGVSGSGKSSLAFDTLYAEGQRRYIESLSSYARQFLGGLPKPDAERITGLRPAISISQKSGGSNVRSTVGTITEIYDFLRLLFARVAAGYCPHCGKPITTQSRQQIIETVIQNVSTKEAAADSLLILAPLVRSQKGEFRDLFASLSRQGYGRARVDGQLVRLTDDLKLDRQMRHNVDVLVDKIPITAVVPADKKAGQNPEEAVRLAEAVEHALAAGNGNIIVMNGEDTPADDCLQFSSKFACPDCGIGFEPPSPQLFSFNTPRGMCPHCEGLGEIHSFDPELLIPDTAKSFQQGCIIPLGRWRDMGNWKQHIFQGAAKAIEKLYELPADTVLETAWEELDKKVQRTMLYGLGLQPVTYTLRSGAGGSKWGGSFEGIIPKMLRQYQESHSKVQKAAMEKYMRTMPCIYCDGERLNAQARSFRIESESFSAVLTLPQLCSLPIDQLQKFFAKLTLTKNQEKIAEEVLKEVRSRIGFLVNVGLEYLTLGRTAPTLSGGEMQRIRLASQIGSGLVGVLYILDEPSIGLHPRDNDRLLATLQRLRDLGNTVIVVEHDEDTMRAADVLVDFGPGPGVHGGYAQELTLGNTPSSNTSKKGKQKAAEPLFLSKTLQFLNGEDSIPVPEHRRPIDKTKQLVVREAEHHNLKKVDVSIPLGAFVCITGVSGSGKSSLVNGIIVEALNRDLNRGFGNPGRHKKIEGLHNLDKLIDIDQSPIGRGNHSNPATYIKVFDEIRSLFAELPDAKVKGFVPGRFSFNVKGGRCEVCEGRGEQRLGMDFLADLYVTCPACEGHRFNLETLTVKYKGKSINDVLNMSAEEALEHFANHPKIRHYLSLLSRVGLGYMKLGQPSPTLSGGEAQRIKLARELVKRSTGRTLYLLDEPTTGLHFADIKVLLGVLHEFADSGNTVLVVEHNLDVIKTADWLIDLGPEGGEAGGYVVTAGTPEEVAECKNSYTGQALKKLQNGKIDGSNSRTKTPAAPSVPAVPFIRVHNATEHNLKNVSVDIPRDKMTVFCGRSGSGKSSMAMDTVYAEGQRRYVESLSSYARQFVGQMQKPKVENIEGLSPAIAIEQKSASRSPRSTVGTVTEIQDYLRVLFARLGVPYCPECDVPIGTQTLDDIIKKTVTAAGKTEGGRFLIAAPLSLETGQQYEHLFQRVKADGYSRVRIDGETYSIDDVPELDRRRKHSVETVVDRIAGNGKELSAEQRSRIAESIEKALGAGQGIVHIIEADNDIAEKHWKQTVHSLHLVCEKCGRSFERLTPHHFSANSPLGWCPHCEGLGVQLGANPALFLKDPKLTLRSGAVRLFPDAETKLGAAVLETFAKHTGIPLDVPFEELDARHRRTIFQGTSSVWYEGKADRRSPIADCRFQFKGLYPAMEEAMRLAPALRYQNDEVIVEVECGVCLGSRLRDDASAVRFIGYTMDQLCRMPLGRLIKILENWKPNEQEHKISGELLGDVKNRLQFLIDVGLNYLTLGRSAPTLSGGETQRIRLAAQIGSGLVGVLYVLDEPTIGLHPRDNRRLISALQKLRDLGNTLLVVEHDKDVIASADNVLDFGPMAGKYGGNVVAQGTPQEIVKKCSSVTGKYLSGKTGIPVPKTRRITLEQAAACPVRKE